MILQDFGIERHEGILKNGVRVVLFQKPNAPIFLKAAFKAGSRYDAPGKEGSAHFLEHLIANGRKHFPSKDLLAEYIESVGGLFGAATSNEILFVDVEIADKEDLGRAMKIFDAIVVSPEFTPEDVEKERGIIIAEMNRAQSKQDYIFTDGIIKHCFIGTGYEHSVVGTVESLNSITYEDLVAVKNTSLSRNNLTFIVAGDITLEELLRELNALDFPISDAVHQSTYEKYTLPASIGTVTHISFPSNQVHIFYGFPGGENFNKQRRCMDIIGTVLAGGRTSRLVKVLRQEKGIIYSVSPLRFSTAYSSMAGVQTQTSIENVDSALETIAETYTLLRSKLITEEELQFAKNKRIKSMKRTMQTSKSWVDFHFYGEVINPATYLPFNEQMHELSQITIEDIRQTVNELLKPEYAIIVTCGK